MSVVLNKTVGNRDWPDRRFDNLTGGHGQKCFVKLRFGTTA